MSNSYDYKTHFKIYDKAYIITGDCYLCVEIVGIHILLSGIHYEYANLDWKFKDSFLRNTCSFSEFEIGTNVFFNEDEAKSALVSLQR